MRELILGCASLGVESKGELSASGLDRLMVKIKAARRKLTFKLGQSLPVPFHC